MSFDRHYLAEHSTLKRRAGYISFDPPSVQLLRLVYKIEFAPLYQSMKTKDQKLAEIKGLARRAAQSCFSVLIFLQFGGKKLVEKIVPIIPKMTKIHMKNVGRKNLGTDLESP